MTSPVKTPSNRFDCFEQSCVNLSDSVIAPVLPAYRTRVDSANVGPGTKQQHRHKYVSRDKSLSIYTRARGLTEKELKLQRRKDIRRAQIRASQARYRQKQRDIEASAQQTVQQLNEEIQSLNLKRQRVQFQNKRSASPWSIVSEVFHLLVSSFRAPRRLMNADAMDNDVNLQRSWAFVKENSTPDVALGELSGYDGLLEQLRRYSLYFGDPQLQLKRIESVAPGVVRATAELGLTITKSTLQHIFPHLVTSVAVAQIKKRLLGQRLQCNCCVTFFFDENSGLLYRLEIRTHFLASLVQVIERLEDVSIALEKAFITPEGALGELIGSLGESP